MNASEETVAAVMNVSIFQEAIIARVEVVTDYTTEGGAQVWYIS